MRDRLGTGARNERAPGIRAQGQPSQDVSKAGDMLRGVEPSATIGPGKALARSQGDGTHRSGGRAGPLRVPLRRALDQREGQSRWVEPGAPPFGP